MTADLEGSPTPVAVDETGIAWESDIKHKFGSQDAQNFNLQEDAEHRGGGTITGVRASPLQVTNLLWLSVDLRKQICMHTSAGQGVHTTEILLQVCIQMYVELYRQFCVDCRYIYLLAGWF